MFKGAIVALVTPFTAEGEVDEVSFADLVEWQISEGIDAILACGITGEAPTLSWKEQQRVFDIAISTARGRVPVIVGTGTYDTRRVVERTVVAKQMGADGCLVIVPYYNRPTPEGCLAHYRAVSQVGLPIIVYHHPGRTGTRLSTDTLIEICKIPNVAALKEASDSTTVMQELRSRVSTPILSGDDTLTLPLMRLGAQGVLSIVANIIPRQWKLFIDTIRAGKWAEAEELDQILAPLYQSMVLETNPQCVKYALGLMGKCRPDLRLPLLLPREENQKKISEVLKKYYKMAENQLARIL